MCFLSAALVSPADSEVIDLKVMVTLGAFNVLVCDQSCNMADIKIQGTGPQLSFCLLLFVDGIPDLPSLMCPSGINGSLLMQGSQTHLSARLRDFIVLNVDPKNIHKKVSQLSYCINADYSYRDHVQSVTWLFLPAHWRCKLPWPTLGFPSLTGTTSDYSEPVSWFLELPWITLEYSSGLPCAATDGSRMPWSMLKVLPRTILT